MNDKQQFYKEFYSALEKAMELSGGKLQEIDMQKNNCTMKAITIRFDNLSSGPTIYPDFYYQDWKDGQPMNEIVYGIRREINKKAPALARFSMNAINHDTAATHLYAAVVGYDNNKEWLKDIPHERVADLAVFAKWRVDTDMPDTIMATKLNDPLLSHLHLTKEEALKIAKANTAREATYRTMGEIMNEVYVLDSTDQDMRDAIMEHPPAPFYVLTTESGIDGASVIACPEVLKAVRKEVGEDFYILPSSVQEVLILPKSETDDVDGLKQMVYSINRDEVLPEDRLSDNVYEFDGHGLKLAGAAELKQDHDISDSITHHRSR